MSVDVSLPQASPAALWTGRVISALPALMLLASGVFKIVMAITKPDGMEKSGPDIEWPWSQMLPLGIVEITCTIIYIIPRTSVLGAILLTGYMGGAIAAHVRVFEPFYMQAIIGVMVWLGLYLRDVRLRRLIPLRD